MTLIMVLLLLIDLAEVDFDDYGVDKHGEDDEYGGSDDAYEDYVNDSKPIMMTTTTQMMLIDYDIDGDDEDNE